MANELKKSLSMKEVQKMKKSNLITGILYVLFGVACLIVALLIETKLEGILWGFAGGLFDRLVTNFSLRTSLYELVVTNLSKQ